MALRPRYVATGVIGLAWVMVSLWLMTRTPPSPRGAIALLVPMLCIAALGAWRRGQYAWSLLALSGIVALALEAARGGLSPQRLYLCEHVAIHVGLALSFGLTLRRGLRPLISRLAERIHGVLTPAKERYTRKVTVAWTLYFSAMAMLSVGLYLGTPFTVWAVFANLGTPVAAVSMFMIEVLLRRRLHPEFERSSLTQMVRAYVQSARPASPRPAPPAPGRAP